MKVFVSNSKKVIFKNVIIRKKYLTWKLTAFCDLVIRDNRAFILCAGYF